MSDFRDVYSKITDRIVADLEQGVRPWMRPWSADHAAGKITRPLRHNGIPYKGINVVMLWSASVVKGYSCPLWLTFNGHTPAWLPALRRRAGASLRLVAAPGAAEYTGRPFV